MLQLLRRRAFPFLLLAILAAAPAHAAKEIIHDWPAGIPSGPELEAAGAIIGEIRVNVGDIFDPSIPSEDNWLYRTANKLHINTRESVVRNQLLFKTGRALRATPGRRDRAHPARQRLPVRRMDPAGVVRRQDRRFSRCGRATPGR